MSDPSLLRFLELARRDLGAEDTRAVIGGRPPRDPRIISAAVEPDFRIEAELAQAPDDPAPLVQRLEALIASFFVLASGRAQRASIERAGEAWASRRLDTALADLAERAGAVAALVMDGQSPVLWGLSLPREALPDVEAATDIASKPLDEKAPFGRACWLAASAVREVRARSGESDDALPRRFFRGSPLSFLCRPFATIYALVLVYDGELSELRAEGTLVQALPNIERLVLVLPPIEPPPRGKAIRLPYLRPV